MRTSSALPARRRGAHQRAVQRAGQAGEDVLAHHHAVAQARGLAMMRKRDAVVVLTAGGRPMLRPDGRPVFRAPSGADYHGALRCRTPGGVVTRPIYVEAKHVAGDRFELREIRPSQRAELSLAARLDALAGLVLVTPRDVYAVRWDAVEAVEARGAKSFALADVAHWRVPRGDSYLEFIANGGW